MGQRGAREHAHAQVASRKRMLEGCAGDLGEESRPEQLEQEDATSFEHQIGKTTAVFCKIKRVHTASEWWVAQQAAALLSAHGAQDPNHVSSGLQFVYARLLPKQDGWAARASDAAVRRS